jgi:pimeloyl-ACP methyl ester carboxylesterase
MAKLTVGSEQGAPVELYYEDQGAGRPVVLIHGLLQDCRSWQQQARLLSDLNTNVTVAKVHGAPHGLAWTHPAEVNQAILAFLEN